MTLTAGRVLRFDDADQMSDLGDHAARGRRIGDIRAAANAIEAEADQGAALVAATPDRAADLLERDGLGLGHDAFFQAHESAASGSTPWRRDCRVDTLMLRRCATERGLSSCFSASNVARIIL